MAEISHLAEAWTSFSRPKTIAFCFPAHGMPHYRVTALQFLLFMFICTYSTILDLGYLNFLARGADDCARRRISGVAATISLQFIGNAVISREAKLHSIFSEPSSVLITCIRDSCSATSLQQKEFTDIPRRAEFIFKCRGHFEQLSDADAKKLFWLEVFGYPTAASLLLTLVIPNVHSGTNLLSMIVYPHHDRFREKDIPTLGSILSQFDMDPSTLFVHCQNVRNTMLEPFPQFNYEEFVLIVQPGANGEPAHFTIPSLKSARLFITSEVTQCVKEGTFIL